MTFLNDPKQATAKPLIGWLALASVAAAPCVNFAALSAPHRPAAISQSSIKSTEAKTLSKRTRPYLVMVGPSVLRFADPEVLPSAEPIMPAKPKVPPATEEGPPKPAANLNSGQPATGPGTEQRSPTTEPNSTTPDGTKPVSILPDDTRREIRAEDVLPFFQFPGGAETGGGGAVIAVPLTENQPQRPTAPPSSATYRQQ
ncbi:MAG: hypothetical protein QM790_15230 [Nibricoccus sp.]